MTQAVDMASAALGRLLENSLRSNADAALLTSIFLRGVLKSPLGCRVRLKLGRGQRKSRRRALSTR